jgi:hypothetical protein
MILARIEEYLSRQKRAAPIDLSRHLGSDPDALRGMRSKCRIHAALCQYLRSLHAVFCTGV